MCFFKSVANTYRARTRTEQGSLYSNAWCIPLIDHHVRSSGVPGRRPLQAGNRFSGPTFLKRTKVQGKDRCGSKTRFFKESRIGRSLRRDSQSLNP
eukprot:Pgem_evm1s15437